MTLKDAIAKHKKERVSQLPEETRKTLMADIERLAQRC